MDKGGIIEALAKGRVVEMLIENIAHQPLTPDLKDLSQMIYVILLEYDADKIVELWNAGEMNFFIARIVLNQYRSTTSTFHYQIRQYVQKAADITGKDWENE